MKKYCLFTLFFLLAVLIAYCAEQRRGLIPVDFDKSLGKGGSAYLNMMRNGADKERYLLLKKIWLERGPNEPSYSPGGTIPKIIHQIWLGPKPIPSFFSAYQKGIMRLHPEWEYRLWRDEDVAKENFELWPMIQQSENFAERSDLARAEILNRYGGVYLDIDVMCIQPLDPIVERYDFFAGLEAPHFIGERSPCFLFISNAIAGASPQHPLVFLWKKKMQEAWVKARQGEKDVVQRVLDGTFLPFGEAIDEGIGENKNSIVFPPTYLFPIQPPNKSRPKEKAPSWRKKILRALHLKKEPLFTTICKETFTVHDFASTWQESEATECAAAVKEREMRCEE